MAHPNASYHPDSHLIKRSLDVPGQAVKDPTLNLQNLKESQHPVPDTTLHPVTSELILHHEAENLSEL